MEKNNTINNGRYISDHDKLIEVDLTVKTLDKKIDSLSDSLKEFTDSMKTYRDTMDSRVNKMEGNTYTTEAVQHALEQAHKQGLESNTRKFNRLIVIMTIIISIVGIAVPTILWYIEFFIIKK